MAVGLVETAECQFGASQGTKCLPIGRVRGHVTLEQDDRLSRGYPFHFAPEPHRQQDGMVGRGGLLVRPPNNDIGIFPAIFGGVELEQLKARVMEDLRGSGMKRVMLGDLQPCGLRILGPVDHEVRLAFAIESVGLCGPPERNLVQAGGHTLANRSARQKASQHHPRLAIVRGPSQMLHQCGFGLIVSSLADPARDRIEAGKRPCISPVPPER